MHIAGYASELGESFRPQVPIFFVKLGYAVSISYVVADTLDKTRRAWEVRMNLFFLHNIISINTIFSL